jgi:hypothetical protein
MRESSQPPPPESASLTGRHHDAENDIEFANVTPARTPLEWDESAQVVGYVILVSVGVALAVVIAMAVIAVVRRQLHAEPFGGSDWGDEGLRGEDALVPVGPPRKPSPAAAVALPLPEPETETVEAFGRELGDGESDTDALAS